MIRQVYDNKLGYVIEYDDDGRVRLYHPEPEKVKPPIDWMRLAAPAVLTAALAGCAAEPQPQPLTGPDARIQPVWVFAPDIKCAATVPEGRIQITDSNRCYVYQKAERNFPPLKEAP